MGAIKRTTTEAGGVSYWFWCSGCGTHHRYVTKNGEGETGPVWTFNGNEERPTFTPSLRCNGGVELGPGMHRCHLFLTDGQVRYLGDCTHHLAGVTVPVEPPCF